MFMFNVATQQHFAKTEKVAAVEGGAEATEIVEVSVKVTTRYISQSQFGHIVKFLMYYKHMK